MSGDRRALAATLGTGGTSVLLADDGKPSGFCKEVLDRQKTFGDEWGIGITLAHLGNLKADAKE
ncbi:MAG: hypothetical protein NNA18_00380 [Nitrospira sp.]|nr:hypothetical protein [Nitrospira sp.]